MVDADTGKVLVFKKKNMLGGRLFNEGETAKATRVKRSTRRRYDRRRERIKLLRCLMWEMVDEKDPDFFARLDEGFLMREDKTIQSKSILFNLLFNIVILVVMNRLDTNDKKNDFLSFMIDNRNVLISLKDIFSELNLIAK